MTIRLAPVFLAVLGLGAVHVVGAQLTDTVRDTIIIRAGLGDSTAMSEVEPLARQYLTLIADKGVVDPQTARAAARIFLAAEGPLPPIETPLSDRSRVWRSAAVRALEMAIARDTSDVWSVTQLIRVASYPYVWAPPEKELQALRALLSARAAAPAQLLVTRIQLELEVGSADTARAWLAALPLDSVSTAIRGHLTAEVAFARGQDSVGLAAYYVGAAAIRDSSDIAWYAREILWIAQPTELTDWRALKLEQREPWLETFWNRRDLDDARLPGERLAEQFRRWRVALRNYRWESDGSTAKGILIPRADGGDTYEQDIAFPIDGRQAEIVYANRMRPLTLVLDDRGGLFLRHGEPAQRARFPGGTANFDELDLWLTGAGPLVVGFTRAKYPGTPGGSLRFGMIARNYPPGDLLSGCQVDARLCKLAGLVTLRVKGENLGMMALAHALNSDYVRMRNVAEGTDDDRETFRLDLHAVIEAYGLPDQGVLIVFAVPVHGLITDSARWTTMRDFAAQVRVVVGDSASGQFAAALDTLRRWHVDKPASHATFLTGYLVVPAARGEWKVGVVIEDTARTVGTTEEFVRVPVVDFDRQALQVSDPILGSPVGGLSWHTGGAAIPLNPRNVWKLNEPAVLNYEVDGLVAGRSYETTIEVWRVKGHPRTYENAVAVRSTAVTNHLAVERELSLRELSPGDYRVVIRIRDTVSGIEVTRERTLTVTN